MWKNRAAPLPGGLVGRNNPHPLPLCLWKGLGTAKHSSRAEDLLPRQTLHFPSTPKVTGAHLWASPRLSTHGAEAAGATQLKQLLPLQTSCQGNKPTAKPWCKTNTRLLPRQTPHCRYRTPQKVEAANRISPLHNSALDLPQLASFWQKDRIPEPLPRRAGHPPWTQLRNVPPKSSRSGALMIHPPAVPLP